MRRTARASRLDWYGEREESKGKSIWSISGNGWRMAFWRIVWWWYLVLALGWRHGIVDELNRGRGNLGSFEFAKAGLGRSDA
jgi:hypothetical protein